MSVMKPSNRNEAVFFKVLLSLSIVLLIFWMPREESKYHAVIIKAAGYIPGTEKPEDPDAITNATSEGGNTHVFADRLAKILGETGIETKTIDFSECRDLSCILHSDGDEKRPMVNLIVFAGPTHGSKLPQQLQDFIPLVKKVSQSYPKIRYTILNSSGNPSSGANAIAHFDSLLTDTGAKTIPGLVLDRETETDELEKELKEFAERLFDVSSIKR